MKAVLLELLLTAVVTHCRFLEPSPPHLNAVVLLFEAIRRSSQPVCDPLAIFSLVHEDSHSAIQRARFPDALNSTMSLTLSCILGLSPTWGLVIKSKREKNNRGSFHSFRDNRCPFSQSFQTERHIFL